MFVCNATGEPADDLYVIRSGRFAVTAAGEREGEPMAVRTMAEGEWFGEIGVVERRPRTATVTAEVDGLLWRIPGVAFLAAVEQAPALPGPLRDAVRARLARTHPSESPTSGEPG